MAMLATLTGCSHLSYLLQAGAGQLALYNRERPLDDAIRDPRTPPDARERLAWIPEIKKMVEDDLGVKATSNYTTYVDLKRKYVVWSLTSAEAFELKTVEWSFPLVGSFPYLGFFREETARAWAAEYEAKGYDTYVRGVGAYSTLGWLRDPLLSSMLSRDKADLVNLIYHETMHGQVYLKGQGSFNEQAASYVGEAGSRAWLSRAYGPQSPELARWREERADRGRFGEMLRRFADELRAYYKDSASQPPEARAAGKKKRFEAFRARVDAEPWKSGRWRGRAITNNAALLALLTYEDDQDLFERLDSACAGNLRAAVRYLKAFAADWKRELSGKAATPQQALREKLLRDAGRAVRLGADVH